MSYRTLLSSQNLNIMLLKMKKKKCHTFYFESIFEFQMFYDFLNNFRIYDAYINVTYINLNEILFSNS